MFEIKYCDNFFSTAMNLSAKINIQLPDTSEIKEGKFGQFDVYHSGKLILSKDSLGRFPTIEEVTQELKMSEIFS